MLRLSVCNLSANTGVGTRTEFRFAGTKNRKFTLTPAGEYFYKKSLVLIADFELMCREASKLSNDGEAALKIGYLRCYSGREFHLAL